MLWSCEISRSAPDARKDGGKTRFFSQGDFRTKIAILPYIWNTNLVDQVRTGRVPGCLRSVEATVKMGISCWYARLLEIAKREWIRPGFLLREQSIRGVGGDGWRSSLLAWRPNDGGR